MKYSTYKLLCTHPEYYMLVESCLAEIMVGINMRYTERTPDGRLLTPKLTIGDQKLFDWATNVNGNGLDLKKYAISILSTYPKNDNEPDELLVSIGKYGELADINFSKNYPILLKRIEDTQAYNAWAMIDPEDWSTLIDGTKINS
jgi:hypothetical protein